MKLFRSQEITIYKPRNCSDNSENIIASNQIYTTLVCAKILAPKIQPIKLQYLSDFLISLVQ